MGMGWRSGDSPDGRSGSRLFSATRLAGRFVWHAARPQFLLSLVAELVAAAALAGVLLSGRELVTHLTSGTPVDQLSDVLPVAIAMGACLIVSGLAAVLSRQARYLVGEQVTRYVQTEIVAVSTSVDFERFEEQPFHDQLNRSNTQASTSSYQIVYDALNLVNVLATSVVVLLVLLTSVPEVVGALLLIGIPAVLAARASARIAFRATYELTPNDRLRFSLYRALTEKAHARELRVFGLTAVLRRRWDRLYDDRMRRLRSVVNRQLVFNGLAALIGAVLVAGVLLVLVQAAIAERITLGDAAVAIVALQQLTTRIRMAASASGSLQEATLFLNDFERFRQLKRRTGDEVSADVMPLPRRTLSVENVTFQYPGTEATVLHGVSLKIAPGEIVGLVGLSGSGKTTLAHLAAGLYRPTMGRITYGGIDIHTIPQAVYWRSLASVFQDFVRYELTARENIALSDHTRVEDLAGVAAAASRAGIADALERLPAGYDTMMSRSFDDGADLSVGQWQRVAVARAFFREAPLLILDEPAAALDAIAEQRLYERLEELCRSRSVLLISHRFSTVRLADRICVMHDGKIIEQGTHDQLMAFGGHYAELFSLQASSYLTDSVVDTTSKQGRT